MSTLLLLVSFLIVLGLVGWASERYSPLVVLGGIFLMIVFLGG